MSRAEARMSRDIVRQAAVFGALAITLAANWAANALPINNQTTGDIANRFDLAIDPATYAFSIWGLIYLGLLGYAVYQALPAQRRNPRLQSIAAPFIVSCLANASWIVLWHHNLFGLSVVVMAVLLGSLLVVHHRLRGGAHGADVGPAETILGRVPFGLYLGWITVAAILNVSIALLDAGWNGWGIAASTWGVVMLLVAMAVAALVGLTRRDLAYAAAVAWAMAAIFVRQQDAPLIPWVAAATATVALATALVGLVARRK